MAETRKILGQSNPAATTLTALYTVPANTQAVVSTLRMVNIGVVDATVRVTTAVGGAALDPEQYQYFDLLLPVANPFGVTEGWTLSAGDVIRVYASTNDVAFTAYGVELT